MVVVEPRRRVVENPVLFSGLFRPSRASLLPARRSHARRRLESARPMVVGRARLVEGCGTSQALTRNPDAALASELSNVPSVLARHVRSSQAPRRTSPFKAGPTPLEHQLSSPSFPGRVVGEAHQLPILLPPFPTIRRNSLSRSFVWRSLSSAPFTVQNTTLVPWQGRTYFRRRLDRASLTIQKEGVSLTTRSRRRVGPSSRPGPQGSPSGPTCSGSTSTVP